MGVRRCVGPDGVHGQFGLRQFERTLGSSNQYQNALGTREINAFEQGAGHSLLCGNAGAVRTVGTRGAHHGFARLAHHGAYVFKVNVHVAWNIDDLGNPTHCVFQHIVGVRKSLILADLVTQHFQ